MAPPKPNRNVYLFVPNIIGMCWILDTLACDFLLWWDIAVGLALTLWTGYLRVIASFIAFAVAFDDYFLFLVFYCFSFFMDAADGYYARKLNQCTSIYLSNTWIGQQGITKLHFSCCLCRLQLWRCIGYDYWSFLYGWSLPYPLTSLSQVYGLVHLFDRTGSVIPLLAHVCVRFHTCVCATDSCA